MKTIEIPLSEYLAYQRLVGYAQSITAEQYVTHSSDYPHDDMIWHHPVTSRWREGLLRAVDACGQKEAQP